MQGNYKVHTTYNHGQKCWETLFILPFPPLPSKQCWASSGINCALNIQHWIAGWGSVSKKKQHRMGHGLFCVSLCQSNLRFYRRKRLYSINKRREKCKKKNKTKQNKKKPIHLAISIKMSRCLSLERKEKYIEINDLLLIPCQFNGMVIFFTFFIHLTSITCNQVLFYFALMFSLGCSLKAN